VELAGRFVRVFVLLRVREIFRHSHSRCSTRKNFFEKKFSEKKILRKNSSQKILRKNSPKKNFPKKFSEKKFFAKKILRKKFSEKILRKKNSPKNGEFT